MDAMEVETNELLREADVLVVPQRDDGLLWTGLSFALHAVFLGAMYFMPPSASALSLETLTDDHRLASYLMHAPEVTEQAPEWLRAEEPGGDHGERAEGESGKAGKPDAKPRQTARAGKSRTERLAEAGNAGILGAIASTRGAWNAPASVFEGPVGYDPQVAIGLLFGKEIGDAQGPGGRDLHGTGRGGGGDAVGTIGLDRVATVGRGGGGQGPGYGRNTGDLASRAERVPQLRAGDADVRGSLSKEVIRRTIQRRLNELRFCYEQELARQPDLRGRVSVKFVIAPSGAVQSALVAGSSLGAQRAETCIQQAVRRMSFPAPDGGGVVIVSYPFVFDAP